MSQDDKDEISDSGKDDSDSDDELLPRKNRVDDAATKAPLQHTGTARGRASREQGRRVNYKDAPNSDTDPEDVDSDAEPSEQEDLGKFIFSPFNFIQKNHQTVGFQLL